MNEDGICVRVCLYKKQCLPSRLLHLPFAKIALYIFICFLRVTLTVVVGTDSTVLFAYIYSRRKSLSSAFSEASCIISPIQINKKTEGSDPTDDSRCCLFCRPDSVITLICVGVFEKIRGKCAHRDLCRYFPEKKRIGEGRRRL